ncbi:phosphatidylinositol N-acetylglucosaminyltransferase, GPI19/PIG-P subunit isoform X2 [Tasmannia lanceolata]|uniref:phosphatidylinositol N-acetylglucosaminyltransferase, GPI19/PIG-P subunit isoform X2 n=1 Tax=Tasmannia lanceolata TaxID=3420 RepID=UPI00406394D4
MADSSVNSPRRMLSLSKERAKVSLLDLDSDEKISGYAVASEEQGPKSSEVYGFVGSITTVITTVIYLIWAYTPEPWLHFLGITYYPSRYWALAVPAFAMMTVVLAMGFYVGLNFMATPPPTSLNTIFGSGMERFGVLAVSAFRFGKDATTG